MHARVQERGEGEEKREREGKRGRIYLPLLSPPLVTEIPSRERERERERKREREREKERKREREKERKREREKERKKERKKEIEREREIKRNFIL